MNKFTLLPRHLFLLALFAAAFLRFWRLDSLPPGLYHDEAYYALDALSLLEGKTFPLYYEGWELYAQDAHAERPATPTRFPVFFEGNYGREPLHVYLLAFSITLFGVTPLAIRVVVAVSGVVGVWTTYLAAGALFKANESNEIHASPFNAQRFIPALAAFALAILYPALTFSRFGIRNAFCPYRDIGGLLFLAGHCGWGGGV